MVTWNNKFVTFLSGCNVIKFSNLADFKEFKDKMNSIGISIGDLDFAEILDNLKRDFSRKNKPYVLGNTILVEYRNGRGFGYGWKSEVEAEDWFGIAPFTWKEVKEEFKK